MRSRREPQPPLSTQGATVDRRAAELMARAGQGDRSAWQALYLEHRDFVYATALRFLGDEAGARDAAQDVFVSLLSRASSYRPTAAFSTYLRRVTVNRCINERASARYRRQVDVPAPLREEMASPDPGPEALLERGEAEASVRAAVAALPDRQRMAVVLARFEGLSYEEIADALDCSVSSVESLLFRARQKLARALAGDERGG